MSAPYYTDNHVTLYLGDCREIDDWLTADVLVTDPPYGIGYASRSDTGALIAGDSDTHIRDETLNMWHPKPALVFGTWRASRPQSVVSLLVWDKWGAGGFVRDHPDIPWGRTHEEIYVLGKWPTLRPGGRLREGGRPSADGSVVRVPGYNPVSADRPDHPTPKPIGLMQILINRCPPGIIADPFAGSGSTLLAAKLQGRKAIGVEIEEKYAEIAARRLSQEILEFPA